MTADPHSRRILAGLASIARNRVRVRIHKLTHNRGLPKNSKRNAFWGRLHPPLRSLCFVNIALMRELFSANISVLQRCCVYRLDETVEEQQRGDDVIRKQKKEIADLENRLVNQLIYI